MDGFRYSAIETSSGRRSHGFLDVGSTDELARRLQERGLLLVTHERAEGGADRRAGVGSSGKRSVVETTRAIASLLAAGMPLTRSLATAKVVARGRLLDALDQVRGRVERGESVAAALAGHPEYFDAFYVGVVRAGERGSDLSAAFSRLADHIERQERVRQQLVSASIYPLILASVGGVALVGLLVFVVPRFVELIQDAGAAAPATTVALLAVSNLLRERWPLIVLLALLAPVAFGSLRALPEGRRLLSNALLRLPILGSLRREVLAARFARLLAVLMRGGAPVLQALDDVAGSIADERAGEEVARVRARVREGEALHAALASSTLFPEMLTRLVAVGEEAGRLTDFLDRAAAMLEERTQRATERAVTLLEPAMIVAFGGIVAVVALSLLQAVYGLNAGGLR